MPVPVAGPRSRGPAPASLMRVLLVCVGRPRDLASATEEYERRAARYWPLEVREVREERGRGLSPDLLRDREGERLLAAAGNAAVIACDPVGEQLTSEAFARWMTQERERAGGDMAFVIGGAFGLSGEVKRRAHRTLSFSAWTLPHELARLVLGEQLYRAGTIVRGEPYHK
jgi:23S rRNA (pseudouridine1915-N3)-methyltransferase